MKKFSHSFKKGFTLIEMIVVVGIFSVVMTIAMGAIFTVVNANKSAHALASVMDNLSSAIDVMSRNTRFGKLYQCGSLGMTVSITGAVACDGGPVFAYRPYDTTEVGLNQITVYKFVKDVSGTTGSLWRCVGSDTSSLTSNCVLFTAPEVKITNMKFYVDGISAGQYQPRAFMILDGYALSGASQQPFHIQTLISQRELNILP